MRSGATPIFGLLLALALAACGEVRWSRPDTDNISAANELAACRAAAHNSTQRMYGPPQVSTGHPYLGAPVKCGFRAKANRIPG